MSQEMFDLLIKNGVKTECPYSKKGCNLIPAPYFQCWDCFTQENHSICPQCAMICHRNHNISKVSLKDSYFSCNAYFCDCGAGIIHKDHPCQICQQPGPNDQCTYFSSNGKSTRGKYYICQTCSCSQICPSCAESCHFGHDLDKKDGEYLCDCGQGHTRNCCLFS